MLNPKLCWCGTTFDCKEGESEVSTDTEQNVSGHIAKDQQAVRSIKQNSKQRRNDTFLNTLGKLANKF